MTCGLISPLSGERVTKPARGFPIGTDFYSTDSLTLVKAIKNRIAV